MKARLQTTLPVGTDWMYEVKLDGIRVLGVKDGNEVKLFSRKPRDVTAEFPEVAAALRSLPGKQLVVDGEVSAFDSDGRTSFQLLQNRRRRPLAGSGVHYILFDLVQLDGYDLKDVPFVERRQVLEVLLRQKVPPLGLSAILNGTAARVWKLILKHGLEGVIAKQKHSRYEAGSRSGAWVKVKAQAEQEFVIGGYTEPEGARTCFGAILVGYYEGAQLRFASKVGTGFDAATLRSLLRLFQKFRMADCPFVNLPATSRSRFGRGLTAAGLRRCTWLRPALVCQVRFQEWTADGCLRQPVFLGLRHDKRPRQVVRE